ncbi:MAG: transglycosylase domain-containing protein [Armatimonadetes bacterium]|nr:transglycosylase domain-containing protein [Armatimonadota bacterium]
MASKSAGKAATKSREASRSRHRNARPPWVGRLKRFALYSFLFGAVLALILGVKFYNELLWAEGMVPKLDEITEQIASNASTIVSADGKVLFRAQAEYRKPAKFEEIPKFLRDATLAAEDVRFYDHRGVDFQGLARALFVNVRDGRTSQGGSTITMQLAKRVYTGPERSFDRKVKDMALAIQIEKTRTKDQILTMYMNQAYYGSGAYGIGAAASVYFNKDLKDLTLSEGAMLARLVQRPSANNPFRNLDRALENRDIVLKRMLDYGMITESQYDQATNERIKLARRNFGSGARTLASPYFVDYVLDFIHDEFPEIDLTKGGYRIETTLNSELDGLAQEEVERVVRKYSKLSITTGAFVLIDSEGRIKAMVGGVDHERNSFNMIFQGVGRQPGSSFKPLIYAAALGTGAMDFHDRVSNEPFYVDDPIKGRTMWPKNSNGKYGGSKSIVSALAGSVNVCAVRTCEQVTPHTAADFAKDVFGIQSPLDPVLALALGSSAVKPLEMAQAYSVFMLRGDRCKPFGVSRIIGPNGDTIAEYAPEIRRGVLDGEVAKDLDTCLRAVVTGGTGGAASVVPNSRGKTGTTSDHRDAWFCGYTNSLVGIGWVANERREGKRWVYDPMNRVFGGKVTIQIWTGVMKRAVKLFEAQEKAAGKRAPIKSTPVEKTPEEPAVDDAAGGDALPDMPPITPPITIGEDPPLPTTGGEGTGDADLGSPVTTGSPGAGKADPRSERRGNEVIAVEICADSGQIANPYCPETVTRTMARAKVPKSKCQMHGP